MRKREHAYLLWTGRGLLGMAPLLQVQFHRVMWLPGNLGSQRCLEKVIALFQLCTARYPYYVLPWSCENGSQPLSRSITILSPLPATINPVWGHLHGWWHGGNWHGHLKHWPLPQLFTRLTPSPPYKSNFIPMSQPFQALVWSTSYPIFSIGQHVLLYSHLSMHLPWGLYSLPRAFTFYQLWKQEPCLAPWRSNVPHRLWYLNACSPIDGTVWRELRGVSL